MYGFDRKRLDKASNEPYLRIASWNALALRQQELVNVLELLDQHKWDISCKQ